MCKNPQELTSVSAASLDSFRLVHVNLLIFYANVCLKLLKDKSSHKNHKKHLWSHFLFPTSGSATRRWCHILSESCDTSSHDEEHGQKQTSQSCRTNIKTENLVLEPMLTAPTRKNWRISWFSAGKRRILTVSMSVSTRVWGLMVTMTTPQGRFPASGADCDNRRRIANVHYIFVSPFSQIIKK